MDIAHFTWINYAEDGHDKLVLDNEYWSVRTFAHHHPRWRIALHTNCVLVGPAWDALVAECPLLEPWPMSLGDIPDNVGLGRAVHRSDWWYMRMLHEHGGIKCDLSDSVTVAPMDAQYASTPLFQAGRDKLNRHFHSGLLMANGAGSRVCASVLKWFADTPNAGGVRSAMEQRLSATMRANPALFAPRWDYRVAYPYFYTEVDALKRIESLPPQCLQMHWYSSSDRAPAGFLRHRQSLVHGCTRDNWRTHDSAYADSVRIAMTGSSAKTQPISGS